MRHWNRNLLSILLIGCFGVALIGYASAANNHSYERWSDETDDLQGPSTQPPCGPRGHCHGHGLALPVGNLIYANGALYGVQSDGGPNQLGTVYSIALPSGNVTSLYNFTGGSDGSRPFGTLAYMDGVLYGTTYRGGTGCDNLGCGTVFAVTSPGQETVIHRFLGNPDGAKPLAGLIGVNGVLYGTTSGGGTHRCRDIFNGRRECGTVFSTTPAGLENVIYDFNNSAISTPHAPLIYSGGIFYGTTIGDNTGGVFLLTPSGNEQNLFQFGETHSGIRPNAGLTTFNGAFFGTTYEGGVPANTDGCGAVYSISGSGNETSVHLFRPGVDGCNPIGSLVQLRGSLYGTTRAGGANGSGSIFKIDFSGRERVIYSFSNGATILAGLAEVNGSLYVYASSGLITVTP